MDGGGGPSACEDGRKKNSTTLASSRNYSKVFEAPKLFSPPMISSERVRMRRVSVCSSFPSISSSILRWYQISMLLSAIIALNFSSGLCVDGVRLRMFYNCTFNITSWTSVKVLYYILGWENSRFMVQSPHQNSRCTCRGRYQYSLRALPRYPWAKHPTPHCSQGPVMNWQLIQRCTLPAPIWSWERLQHRPQRSEDKKKV